MDDQMNKTTLLQTLRSRRAEWDATLAQVPTELMTEPGVAGKWSVKDLIMHLTYHERWYADRLHEQLRDETYTPTEVDAMDFDTRNDLVFRRNRDRPLPEVLQESRQAYADLLQAVETHSEEFLIVPQRFEGMTEPIAVWTMLRGDIYDHYPQHIPTIREWLASRRARQTA